MIELYFIDFCLIFSDKINIIIKTYFTCNINNK